MIWDDYTWLRLTQGGRFGVVVIMQAPALGNPPLRRLLVLLPLPLGVQYSGLVTIGASKQSPTVCNGCSHVCALGALSRGAHAPNGYAPWLPCALPTSAVAKF